MNSGLIFDIKRYSINDGPGIRLTVFFKGCPLHCAWCHNPESISPHIQKMYNRDKCIGCGACVLACPEEACAMSPEGVITDRERCTGCGMCADICPTRATEMSGRIATVDEIVEIVEKERLFFDQSGGGVTFSGGEPLQQHEFLCSLLQELGSRSIHRAVDTTAFAKTETVLAVAAHTDLFLIDLKMMDSEKHRHWTGVGNETILENIRLLADTGACINIRIPLIGNVNDDLDNMSRSAAFIAALPGAKKTVNLLPYHNIMAGKHERLGSTFDQRSMTEPDKTKQDTIVRLFADHGLKAQLGG